MVFHNISYPFKKIALIFFCAFIFHDLPARQYQDTPVAGTTADSTEITTGDAADDRSIAADDNITPRQLFTKRIIPDSVVSNLKKQQAFEYANDTAYWKEKVYDTGSNDLNFSLANLGIIRMLIWIAVTGLLLFLFYNAVIKNKLYMFYSSSAQNRHDDAAISEIEDDNLDDKIREAVNGANYRSAVRYMYLKSLKLLNEKGWIKYTAQGSNAEYVSAVNKHAAGESFRYLTRNYEYVWYGEFTLNEERFGFINGQFEQFYQSLKTSGHSIKSIH